MAIPSMSLLDLIHKHGVKGDAVFCGKASKDLRIPTLREGSYFPSILQPRRNAERALVSGLQEAYGFGVSTRKVDDLVKSLGISGVSKSEVSRVCTELDEVVATFRNRPLEAAYPYLWLDATYLKVRENGRVLSMAMVVAVAVRETGAAVLAGACWQRCRVHFLRNALSLVPKTAQPMVAGVTRTVFTQPDQDAARAQMGRVLQRLAPRFSRVAALLQQAQEDIFAFMSFPAEHRRQIHSTNPLERLNKEIKRRTDVVGIFPNREAAIRLVGAVLAEQNDEWLVGKRYFSQASMSKLAVAPEPVETGLLAAD